MDREIIRDERITPGTCEVQLVRVCDRDGIAMIIIPSLQRALYKFRDGELVHLSITRTGMVSPSRIMPLRKGKEINSTEEIIE